MGSAEKSVFRTTLRVTIAVAFLIAANSTSGIAVHPTQQEETLRLQLERSFHAHGDAFNGIVLVENETKLVIGSQKGNLLVWSIPEQKIIRQFKQGSSILALRTLADGKRVAAAGGNFEGVNGKGELRIWNLENGTSEPVPGIPDGPLVLLATDPTDKLLAAASASGRILAWNQEGRQLLAQWELAGRPTGLALSGRTIFVTMLDESKISRDELPANTILTLSVDQPQEPPSEVVGESQHRFWANLSVSPDENTLAATFYETEGIESSIAFLSLSSGKELATFKGLESVWLTAQKALLFDWKEPRRLVQVGDETISSLDEFSWPGTWHVPGSPAGEANWVVARANTHAWGVFEQGAALTEWNLEAKSKPTVLTMTPGLVFAMDAYDPSNEPGLLLTGGDDGYVRIWDLDQLSLRQEFKMPEGVPQGAALLDGGTHAVFSFGLPKTRTTFAVGNIETGEWKIVKSIEQAQANVKVVGQNFLYLEGDEFLLTSVETGETLRVFSLDERVQNWTVSENGNWLAASDENGFLYLLEVSTGKRLRKSQSKIENLTRLTVTNDGKKVFTTEFHAKIRLWETQEIILRKIGEHRGQCVSLRLSADEKWLVLGGNHQDVMIFDSETGKEVLYLRTREADFYVTNALLLGNRLLFTTDVGILMDGLLKLPAEPRKD